MSYTPNSLPLKGKAAMLYFVDIYKYRAYFLVIKIIEMGIAYLIV